MEKSSSTPGPVKGPEMRITSVNLPPELVDWAKRQPGGLSAMVRDCLETRFKDQQAKQPKETE